MATQARIIIVAGFHRSFTSVAAQWLHKAGLPMGSYLMPSNIFNPDGYYEDMPLVSLHDAWLARNNTTWQFHDETSLDTEQHLPFIDRYIQRRNHIDGSVWGMKDPRQCLFLTRWSEKLENAGRYLIIIRHWAASIQSLLNRHSAVIAFHQKPTTSDSAFWTQPKLAADMWIAYNRRLLSFVKACNNKHVLVITQKAMLKGFDLIEAVNTQFELSLNKGIASPIKPTLAHDSLNSSMIKLITPYQKKNMDSIWNQLLQQASVQAENEEPHWESTAPPVSKLRLVNNILNKTHASKSNIQPQQPKLPADWYVQVSHLQRHPYASKDLDYKTTSDLDYIFHAIKRTTPYDAAAWEHLARSYLTKGQALKAKSAILNAMLSGRTSPHIFSQLGECEEAMLNAQAARHFYTQAIARSPKNSIFYTRLAYLLLSLGKYQAAEKLLRRQLERGLKTSTIYHSLAITLDQQGKTNAAINLIKKNFSTALEELLITLLLKKDYFKNIHLYRRWMFKHINNSEAAIPESALKILNSISNPIYRQDLALRITEQQHSIVATQKAP